MRRLTIPLAALVALAAAVPAANATFPGRNGSVAFSIEQSRNEQNGNLAYRAISTVKQPDFRRPDARGRHDRLLRECRMPEEEPNSGDCSIDYRDPAWSPDGRRLVFDTGRSLALIDARGSRFRKLEAFSADDGEPAFSPSGSRIAFSGRSGARKALFVANLSGGQARRVASEGGSPDWSRRDLIAFVRRGAIYSVRASGSDLQRLTAGRDPSWAPSGREIAFARRDGIYVARADGRRARRVVRCSGCRAPAFSPDGGLLVYDGGGLHVARVRDGRRLLTLVEDVPGFDASSPAWQPLR